MTATANCTCHCPDGADQHLENCEVYLRYWEIDMLERIKLRREQLLAADPRNLEIVEDLIAKTAEFILSVDDNISDPRQVIRRFVRRV